jgi:hypothetical protein
MLVEEANARVNATALCIYIAALERNLSLNMSG